MELLKFQKGNAKLDKTIHTFSLPAGHSCPGADICLAKADRDTGKITDGKNQEIRCFAASQEALYTNTRKARWHNYDLLKEVKTVSKMQKLIKESLPKSAEIIRVHVSGDFFNQNYFDAWLNTAINNPSIKFYAYTKSVNYWMARTDLIPDNFRLTGSIGGKHDAIIQRNNLKYAEIILAIDEAEAKGLEIDHDDSHAYDGHKSFALLVHGTQKKGSVAASALTNLRKVGIKGYSKKK
jgi:hypothetical protein